jgi:hypothetical protein
MRPELVKIAVALFGPVNELDAQLEGALRSPHEFGLIQAHRAVECFDGRNGGFAHTDGANFVGLNQSDLTALSQRIGQRGCCHPSSGAASNNDDVSDLTIAVFHA